MTVPEIILSAASGFYRTFSAEELVVAVWHRCPARFGLSGYAQTYPDSNKVLASLMGAKGMVSRGWIRRVAPREYVVTDEGRQYADELEPEVAMRRTTPLPRRLAVALASTAFRLYDSDRRDLISWSDAVDFWRFDPKETFGEAIKALEAALLPIKEEDLRARMLSHCHAWMASRFERQIDQADGLRAMRKKVS